MIADENEEGEEKSEAGSTKYQLIGVVVHSGQASGGHYYSYILHRSVDICLSLQFDIAYCYSYTCKPQPFLTNASRFSAKPLPADSRWLSRRKIHKPSPAERPVSRDVPKFGLGRTLAEYSAEGFGSVRFGHASTFGRTSILFGFGFAPRSAHFIACVQSLYSKN